MKVTLHEVAKRAGVSIATASRVLNGLTASPLAKEQVRRAVADLGYVVNEAGRTLRLDRTLTMGLIFHDFHDAISLGFIDAVSEAVEQAGYSLLIATARADDQVYDRLLRRFLERRVDAVLCVNPKGSGEVLARYTAAEIPVILLDPDPSIRGMPSLTLSLAEATAALVQRLASLGHQRLALVTDGERLPPPPPFGEAVDAAGMSLDVIESTEAGGMSEVIAGLLNRREPPTAVVAFEPNAHLLIASCQAAGITVPEDLSIIAISQGGGDRWPRRGLSILAVEPHRVGRVAAASILAWLAGSRPADNAIVQAGAFYPGDTIGPARQDWNQRLAPERRRYRR